MMRNDLLVLAHRLREFVTVVYGPVMSYAFPDVQVKAYRNSVLYVNIASVVDCSVLNWVKQKELRRLVSDDRLFGRIAEPGWILMVYNNSLKCRMGDVDDNHFQFNPKLWNLRPVAKDTGEAMRVPAWPEAYAHVRENQGAWLAGSRPLPSQCTQYPAIRRMLLVVTSPVFPLVLDAVMRKKECRNGVKGWSRASSVEVWQRCTPLTSVSLMHGAERRLKRHPRENPTFPPTCGVMYTHQPMICHD